MPYGGSCHPRHPSTYRAEPRFWSPPQPVRHPSPWVPEPPQLLLLLLPAPLRAFRRLDSDGSGVLEVDELLAALRDRLPPEEVRSAVEEALREASAAAAVAGFSLVGAPPPAAARGLGGLGGMDFETFMKMLMVRLVRH